MPISRAPTVARGMPLISRAALSPRIPLIRTFSEASPAAPERRSSGILLPTLGFTVLLAGTYVGGLYASESSPELKKIYDEYLPYTDEARRALASIPKDLSSLPSLPSLPELPSLPSLPELPSLPSLPSLPAGLKDYFPFLKDETKPADKVAPKDQKVSNQNAPFVPKEGVKVVVTEPAGAAKKPAAATKPPVPEPEAEEEAPISVPPTNAGRHATDKAAPLIGLEEEDEEVVERSQREEVVVSSRPLPPPVPTSKPTPQREVPNEKVEALFQEVQKLNDELEDSNRHAVAEVLDRSRKNLKQADDAMRGLESEIQELMKKTESVLSSTRTAELQDEIQKLRNKLVELAEDKKAVEEAFKKEVDELHVQLQKESQARLEELQAKHQQDLHELASRHDRDLAQQYRTQENMYNLRVKEELQKQEEALETLFREELDVTLKKERGERMAKIEKLAASAKVMEQISRKQSVAEQANQSVRQVLVAMTSFQDAIENRRPFLKELDALKRASTDLPLVQLALDTIPEKIAEGGISTPADLASRFATVKEVVSGAAFVSPNGGMWSFATSWLLSSFAFAPSGNVEGDDVNAILARAEYQLMKGDIESATRELNQLKGWQKKLSQDWLISAREYLTVHQAFALVETEVSHQLLAL